jgi:SAM-dependent methyltransferase
LQILAIALKKTAMRVRDIKRWLRPLRYTPLHPQWLLGQGLQTQDLEFIKGLTVDIGCSDQTIRRILPTSAQYIGLDYYQTAVDWYSTRPDAFADARCLPLADGSIDSALMLHVLEHIDRPELALSELARILRPGGQALVEVPFVYPLHDAPLDFRRWTRFGLAVEIEKAGLQVVQIDTVGRATETAALLFNLAIARLTVDWISCRSPLLMIAPILWLLIPLLNIGGWIVAPLQSSSDFMPHRVRVTCEKPVRGST